MNTIFIGKNLRNLRILHGYTQIKLSELSNISEHDIWQYENGYKKPTFEHINILKGIFHVKATYFYRNDLIHEQPNNINVHHISFRFLND
ncbi:helix-turn-helix domain-containing protein [Lysinibacillus sp. UGB7]|uniref:helix-turn-helix domain-containing protein n=1 Tax=Lysinibacillus sp. UGB7 TaxID=3411039 RepID=UPI003B7CBB8C